MKKLLFGILLCMLIIGKLHSQNVNQKNKVIDVTGSAEMYVEPDEILINIKIEEYWLEEFNPKAKFQDYKTKIVISDIEKNLFTELSKFGFEKENILICNFGNYWRHNTKDILLSKEYQISFKDFSKVDEFVNSIKVRGIESIYISELKNKNITEYRKQVKIDALKAAQVKADYLLNAMSKKTGEIISISEVNDSYSNWGYNSYVNSISNGPSSYSESSGVNFRKIKLRYEMNATFEIK